MEELDEAPGDAVAGFVVPCTLISFVVTVEDFRLLPKFNCDSERGKRDRNGALTVGVVTAGGGGVGVDVVGILLLMLILLLLFIDFSKYAEPCVYEIFFIVFYAFFMLFSMLFFTLFYAEFKVQI